MEARVIQFSMLDANDVRVLEKMFSELRGEMQELRGEMHQGFDEVRKEFVRVQQEFGKVRNEMARGFEKVRDDIIDVIDENIQPQLTSSVSRITRLERRAA